MPVIPKEKWDYMLDEYYRHRGCDKNGLPLRSKYKELGMKDVADAMEKRNKLGKEKQEEMK